MNLKQVSLAFTDFLIKKNLSPTNLNHQTIIEFKNVNNIYTFKAFLSKYKLLFNEKDFNSLENSIILTCLLEEFCFGTIQEIKSSIKSLFFINQEIIIKMVNKI